MNTQETSITHSALGWVKKSIDDNLSEIKVDLKQYIEAEDAELLVSVKKRLAVIQGVLMMIEQYGAAMLTEEMLALADFIASEKQDKGDQALEVLLRAVLQLPDYLEHIQSGHRDIPIAILPLLNDIRSVRNQDLFSEKLLFLPDLSMHEEEAESDAIDERHNQASRLLAKKLRPVYQLALVNVIRDKNVEVSLKRLEKVCETLEERSASEQIARIWWIVGALIESVSRQQLELGVSIKNLLGKVDALFRVILIIGERGLLQRQPIELIKNFLFYVAQPECDGPKAQAIKTAYRLEQFLPSESVRSEVLDNIAGPNQALLKTVAEAMKAEIETVKSTLEVYVNGDLSQVQALKELPQEMHVISDTLAMIGLGSQRQLIEAQIGVVKQIVAAEREADEEQLLSMAAELLQVEQALDQMPKRQPPSEPPKTENDVSRDYELDSVLGAVVTAALDDIQKTKTAILEYVKDPERRDNIELSINLMLEFRGALVLMEQQRAVDVVDGLMTYLRDYKLEDFMDSEQLDALSGVVVSLEYYLEALGERRRDAGSILKTAESQLSGLLARLESAQASEAQAAAAAAVETAAAETAAEVEQAVEPEPVVEPEPASEPELTAEPEPVAEPETTVEPEPEPVAELELEPVDEPEAELSIEAPAAPASEPGAAEAEVVGDDQYFEVASEAYEFIPEDPVVEEPTEEAAAAEAPDPDELVLEDPDAQEPEVELIQDTQVIPESKPDEDLIEDTQIIPGEAPADEAVESTQVMQAPAADELLDAQSMDATVVVAPLADQQKQAGPNEPEAKKKTASATSGLKIESVEEELEVLKPGSDPEILDIYLEEAEEESANIARLQRDWLTHPEDENALKNIRRAFHTIKGSGRLVGAMKIGEFAWDYEQLLNRVIDKTVPPNPQVIEAVGHAARALPELVDELKTSTPPQAEIGYLRGLARALAEFKTEELLLDHTQTLSTVESPHDHITNADIDVEAVDDASFADTTQVISSDPEAPPTTAAEAGRQAGPETEPPASGLAGYDDTMLTEPPPIPPDDERRRLQAEAQAKIEAAAKERAEGSYEAANDYSRGETSTEQAEAGPADQATDAPTAADLATYDDTVLSEAPPIVPMDEARQRAEAEARERNEAAARARAEGSYESATDYSRSDADAHEAQAPADDGSDAGDVEEIHVESIGDDFLGEDVLMAAQAEPSPPVLEEESAAPAEASPPTQEESAAPAREAVASEAEGPEPEDDDEAIELSPLEESEAQAFDYATLDYPGEEAIELSTDEDSEVESIEMSGELVLDEAADELDSPLASEQAEEIESEEITMETPLFAEDGAEPAGDPALEQSLLVETESEEITMETPVSPESGEEIEFEALDDFEPLADEPVFPAADEQTQPPAEDPPDPLALTTGSPVPGEGAEVSDRETAEPDEPTALSFDPELLTIYQQEVEQHLAIVSSALERAESSGELIPSEEVYRALHTIHGASRTADIASIGELAGLMEKPLKSAISQNMGLDHEIVALYREGQRALHDMTSELVATRNMPEIPSDLKISLTALADDFEEHTVDLTDDASSPGGEFVDTLTMMNESAEAEHDTELLEIFVDEANELLEMSDNTLHQWSEQQADDPDSQDFSAVMELQRYLHTLKGGARMAELKEISDLSHEMESLFIAVIDGRVEKTDELVDLLKNAFDLLHRQVSEAQLNGELSSSTNMVEALQGLRHGDSEESREDIPDETPGYAMDSEDIDIVSENLPGESLSGLERPAQDVIKVRADLLDNLVSSAGEVSIYRARMEQQVAGLGSYLGELGQTIARVKAQLRNLEAETDAQIHYSHRTEAHQTGEFDPLEMDRYTMIQELSRSLSESVNDLSSLQNMLGEQVKDSETLLLQQSRVSTDLQDGLIKSRMVRFSGLLSRLRRLVRQSSQELGKKAELVVTGEQNEVDNKVLDRMVAPLEHIIRNALSHGIETPVERVKKGKPETGQIAIDITRDGSDVVIKVSDDGAGVDIEKVRSRAIQLGLLEKGHTASDADLVQYILEPGFSTAEHVTQLSGRGVGMDVVDIEVKQLGGTLHIETTPQGTTFIARLPFTLSINQAILVRCGDETYAIPLLNIEGITRIDAQQLHAYYREENPEMEYAGQNFSVHNLARLVDTESHFRAGVDTEKQAVILARAGDIRVALHVDEILGNREIVVKNLGKQLSQVKSLAGASILADGSVVLILDVGGLIRHSVGSAVKVVYHAAEKKPGKLRNTVMVVDDSITMRRIASKLLERHNYEVITAKDGVDALAQLVDVQPDVMLLDIEMPRMDGFELATHMQNEASYSNIPIIMITSRTGEKHRDRAFEIGVSNYMGKPYQEDELVENIQIALAGG